MHVHRDEKAYREHLRRHENTAEAIIDMLWSQNDARRDEIKQEIEGMNMTIPSRWTLELGRIKLDICSDMQSRYDNEHCHYRRVTQLNPD